MSPSADPLVLKRLNDLISALEANPSSREGLMRAHLEDARFYLNGAMPAEYRLNLKLAEESQEEIEDENLRDRISQFLRSQRAAFEE
jgi:hypothetical protein